MLTGEAESNTRGNDLRLSRFFDDGERIRLAWLQHRSTLLQEWIKQHPGTRPWAWWKFDSPKEPVAGWEFKHSAQRLRLGGNGTPSHEVLSVWGGFERGIPNSWIDQREADYYNGKMKDIHGKPIPTKYKEGDFKGMAIDPEDPPRFESEAAYLDRHGLLSTAEKRHIEKHPELMERKMLFSDVIPLDK